MLKSELPQAVEAAIHGDERLALESLRLLDLLNVLCFEGRRALPKVRQSRCVFPDRAAGPTPAFDRSALFWRALQSSSYRRYPCQGLSVG